MKVVIKVHDVVELARRFEASPAQAMRELTAQVKDGVKETIERLLEAEIELFLGRDVAGSNKRNGFRVRTFAMKGIGALQVRVPRDRLGRFDSKIVPAGRRYDEALEKDLALLHLCGISTRMLSHISRRVLGLQVSPQEVSNALQAIVPQAKAFLERPLSDRNWKYLYIDGTNFSVRRTTVAREPTLVVIGVDDAGKKSVLAMVQGDKDSKAAWQMVFAMLKERGLDTAKVQLGLMDGLPGLSDAFVESFPLARVARCWVHKARNVMPLVPRRYQAEFKSDWDKMAYAKNRDEALSAFSAFKARWEKICGDAVMRFEKDIDALFSHYDFPQQHWASLRTTNPIERVNKEFKRRSKSMEQMGPDGLKALLAFTALRLEFGWSTTPIDSPRLANLKPFATRPDGDAPQLEEISRLLLN